MVEDETMKQRPDTGGGTSRTKEIVSSMAHSSVHSRHRAVGLNEYGEVGYFQFFCNLCLHRSIMQTSR